jgi:fructosamine-3-kinase
LSQLRRRVASLTGVAEDRIERLAGGDLSEVLLVTRNDGSRIVAKGGAQVVTEAEMLRALATTGAPVPAIEGEYGDTLLIEHIPNDGAFSPRAWADIGRQVRAMHGHEAGEYGWPVDHSLGSVLLDNQQTDDWRFFWTEKRLRGPALLLDLPWRKRIDALAPRLMDVLPPAPPAALLHGDLWTGNLLVREGKLAALIDPACYHGDPEVDLAMLCLFGSPDEAFWQAYGELQPGWAERRLIYQLFPAIMHLRLFGATYEGLVDRLLTEAGA